jgi:hypothetical protein
MHEGETMSIAKYCRARLKSGSRIIPGLAVAVLAAGPAFGQGMPCSSRAVISQVDDAPFPTAVEGDGDLLFVGSPGSVVAPGHGLSVYDLSDPVSPVLLGFGEIDSQFLDLAITGGKAFVAAGSDGLLVVDVSDPTSPTALGSLMSPGIVRVVEALNGYAVMGDLVGQVTIVDVSDPKAPIAAAEIFTASTIQDIAIEGNTLFVATRNGLEVFDLTAVDTPILLGTFDSAVTMIAVDIVGDTAVVLRADGLLLVLDRTDPAAMTMLGQVQLPADMREMRIFGDRALVSSFGSGVIAVDTSNPAEPVIVGSIGLPAGYRIGAISDLAVFLNQSVVQVVDPAAITLWDLGTTGAMATVFSVTTSNEIAFITGLFGGTEAIDIADPAMPISLGSVSNIGFGAGIAENNGIVFVADGPPGLTILDFTDPANPSPLAQDASLGSVTDVAFAGDYLLAVARAGGEPNRLVVLDVSTPASPVVVAEMVSPQWEGGTIFTNGDRLVVAHELEGLALYDISDPINPALLGTFEQLGVVSAVAFKGDLVLSARTEIILSNWIEILSIVDFEDPANPVFVGEKFSLGGAHDLQVFGDQLLYAGFDKLRLLDISDPAAIEPVAEVTLGSVAGRAIAPAGSIALIAQQEAGLRIIDMSDCPPNPPCPPDLNDDGLLDFFDLQVFLNWYASGDLRADLTADGVLDFFDVQEYLNLYSAGCP